MNSSFLDKVVQLRNDERGLMSAAHAVQVMFLTMLVVCLLNVGISQHDRTQQQQQADGIANSLGVLKARHLNSLTAQQHLMGELFAMAIIHHALGGDNLDNRKAADTSDVDRRLETAYRTALSMSGGNYAKHPAYKDVSSPVFAENALLKGSVELKELLTKVYWVKVTAYVMKMYPPTRPAGTALENAANAVERLIHREWKVIQQIYRTAVSLTQQKQKILKQYLPKAKKSLDQIVKDHPAAQQELASYLGKQFDVNVSVLESDRRLPVKEDPLARLFQPPNGWKRPTDCDCPTEDADNMRHQLAKVSQLARVTFPWVNYHREPLVRRMKQLVPLSKLGTYYFDYAAGVSKDFADRYQRRGQLALYTLDDYDGPDKAHESWMEESGSADADRTFGLTVIVGAKRRPPIGKDFFQAPDGDYTYRIATAMVWNRHAPAKPKHRIDLYCKRIVPSFQASTGWDLIAWKKGKELPELVGFGIPQEFPAIEMGWTSQATPTTAARVKQLSSQPNPSWATNIRDVLPKQIPSDLEPF